jgi:ribose-phosphate pyrophosphokinase
MPINSGFFDVPVDHLYASSIFVPYIRDLSLDNIAIAAPDMGGAKVQMHTRTF